MTRGLIRKIPYYSSDSWYPRWVVMCLNSDSGGRSRITMTPGLSDGRLRSKAMTRGLDGVSLTGTMTR